MKTTFPTAALFAQLLIGQSIAARVIATSQGQILVLEDAPSQNQYIPPGNSLSNLVARQGPTNEVPQGAAPGGETAPKDMQPKPNDVKPQPTPIVTGPNQPNMPVPVSSGMPLKPPVVVRRRQAPKGDDPVLPKIPKQPSPPGIPPPKMPVPTETGKPAPLTFSRVVKRE